MKKNQLIWFICVSLAIVSGVFVYHFYLEKKWINLILFLLIGFGFIFTANNTLLSQISKAEKIILSIRQKDFSLFPKNDKNSLVNNTVKLYYQRKEEYFSQSSFKLLYEEILNHLEIGMMILSEKNKAWKVFYVNPVFLEILQVPKYNSWNLYKNKMPDFYQIIEETRYENSQEFFDVSINENAKQSFSLRTEKVQNTKNRFCIISLESVQKIIEQKEKLAWNNLMKVISHELLNTLTPINSLIQNLEYLANEDELSKDDQKDMKDSLKIINSKSAQLLHFIDSYRQVAELPKPKKHLFNLANCVENVLLVMEPEFAENTIEVQKNLKNISINADEKMIERVIINLLTNSVQSLKSLSEENNKLILVEIFEKNNRVFIRISDNGEGINPLIADKIFLPFFTTKSSGSGIGLTLSKSIMEAHKGYLTNLKTHTGTSFEICFLDV